MPQEARNGERILILLARREETAASRITLSRNGYAAVICSDIQHLCREIEDGAAVVLLSQEILDEKGLNSLRTVLRQQPKWSHLPVLILSGEGEGKGKAGVSDDLLAKLEPHGCVTLLEGPVRVGTMVTSVRSNVAYRRRQYETRDLMREIETSHKEAVDANRTKSDFLANMSHEIRTPLGAVLGFAELLMDSGVSDREKQVYITAIKRNGQMLSALVDDILDLANVESGKIEPENIEFSLSEVVDEAVSTFEPKASKKSLPLIVRKAAQVPELISSDPVRLRQVVGNLLGNAIKFTSHGSVSMRLEAREVEKGSELRIEIEDTGIGISPQQTGSLFKPFSQVDSSATRRFGGTGLGLVLSRKLMRAMGGDVSLKWSIPGGGSCFLITLPMQAVQRQTTNPAQEEALPLDGSRILVVDDSLDNQVLIGRILSLLGAEVELANDGIEGVEKAMHKPFDAVLMDLQMPRLGGVEATRILREKGYESPIIALTAHALKEDRQRCLSVGCSDYLTKPIQKSHLVQVLERYARPTGSAQTH